VVFPQTKLLYVLSPCKHTKELNIEYLTFAQLRAFAQRLRADVNLIITMNLRHIDGFLLTLYEQENSTSSTRPLHTMKKK
jgi:hypothetical protein